MRTYTSLVLLILAAIAFQNTVGEHENQRKGRQFATGGTLFQPVVPAVAGAGAAPVGAAGTNGFFNNFIIAKLRAKGLLPAQVALPVNPVPTVSTITTTQLQPTTTQNGNGGAGTTVTSSFTTPTTVAVPPAVAAIGGPGAALSSDDPEDGQDGAFLRNRLRANCNHAVNEDSDDGEDDYDDDDDNDDDDEEETDAQFVESVEVGRDEQADRRKANQEKLARQNQALIRQIRLNNRRRQATQKRVANQRRRRAAARRRSQQAKQRAQRRNRQNRLNRLRQQTRNRQRRRNFLRG